MRRCPGNCPAHRLALPSKNVIQREKLRLRESGEFSNYRFFENVEEGIILEDDCLPHPDFFRFCVEMLERYRQNNKIMHISGDNFQFWKKYGSSSYYFSQIAHIWGWATWRRAWKYYNFKLPDFTSSRHFFGGNRFVNENFKKFYMGVCNGSIDTWDCQWTYSILCNNGLTIIPNSNLVSNIGFGGGATHTKDENSVNSCIITDALNFPLKHPKVVKLNKSADLRFNKKEYNYRSMANRAWGKLKSIVHFLQKKGICQFRDSR